MRLVDSETSEMSHLLPSPSAHSAEITEQLRIESHSLNTVPADLRGLPIPVGRTPKERHVITIHRFAALLAALGLVLASACTSGTEGTAGNTELNLDIINPGGDTGAGFSIDRVDYRITCAGNAPGSYPIAPADTAGTDYNYDDAVDISGAFETVDTRDPPVWQAVMDLPPGLCTITLSVYEDDEIVCVGSQTLAINEDLTTKYDIVLVCSLSIDTPDGMADVDGEFFFITGNICPKLYVLNAIPSTVVQDATNPDAASEIQYRAKDPDNTCGSNCDPQSCTTTNPPVCTPYPSNINDPACNPAAGGDPNSVDCQAGVYAGLVCTVAGWPSASNPGGPGTGAPGGTFISPADGVTPVGPILPVNLNLASGVPGIVLPGLGGPAGSNAANSPAYPGLPNVNGSLPPLVYQCDTEQPGPTFITVSCSDGDAECDQSKFITLECPGVNFCIEVPITCDSGNECTTNGACDPNCDPSDIGGPDCPDGTRCPGEGSSEPDGTACTVGGNVCSGGSCVQCLGGPSGDNVGRCILTGGVLGEECADNTECPPAGNTQGICRLTNEFCPNDPPDCLFPSFCSGGNTCTGFAPAPAGTPCSNGECDSSGVCQFVAVDPPAQSAGITVGCTNNVTADISILPFVLDVDPGVILSNQSVTADFAGVAEFSEVFLDAAQGAVPGGVTAADLVNLVATVQIRTGGTFASTVGLTNAPLPTTCLIGGTACNPANDGASVPGSQPNTDCVPTGTFNPCQALVSIPISSDCAPGGVCDGLGKLTSQCDTNGFCVTGGLPLPLASQTANFTADASGIVNFGFADQGTGATIAGDGTYNLPAAVFTGPTQLNEIKVNASGLSVALVCTMAVDAGGPNGVGVPDLASPTPTSLLNTFNIQVP